MALAQYFSKDLLAINQVLKTSNKELENILLDSKVGVAFDKNGCETREGLKALDLIIRLLSRLYPSLNIIDLSNKNKDTVSRLRKLSTSINGQIEIGASTSNLDVLIVAGESNESVEVKGIKVFLGSDNWLSKVSTQNGSTFGNSENPFGCGVAACIAASNTFRYVFREFLHGKPLDKEVIFSTLHFNSSLQDNPIFAETELKDSVLVGVGAIGNGVIWALRNNPLVRGKLDIIDNEEVAISNLQRYVMFDEEDVGKSKVAWAAKMIANDRLKISTFQMTWDQYLKQRENWMIETVAVALDNKRDRIKIQSALPRRIINAYTESNLIGIARHIDFAKSACLACGYIPMHKERNYTEEVALNCNIPALSDLVKDYLNLNLGVEAIIFPQNTSSLLDAIAQANGISRDQLTQFHGKKINQFYSEFICGGISLSMTNSNNVLSNIEAPLAFQSAMAGILLAAEIVIDANGMARSGIKLQSHIYPLNILSEHNPFNHILTKDQTTRCICADSDFLNQYASKWR